MSPRFACHRCAVATTLRFSCLSVRQLAARQNLSHRYINRLLPLAWLAPEVVEAIIDGTQLPEVSLDQLTTEFPIDWAEQRRLLALEGRR